MKHRASHRSGEPYVDFSHAGLFHNGRSIVDSDSAASHDGDPAVRGWNQPRDRIHALQALLLTAGRKEPVRARRTDIFESAKKVRGHVESAMKRDRERPRQFD